MKDTDPYFKKLRWKSTFLYDHCVSLIENLDDHKEKLVSLPEFTALQLDKNCYLQEPIVKKLNETFEIGMAGIFITDRNSGCDFHVDEPQLRHVAINMLISSGVSHSIFKTKQEKSYKFHFKELVYEKKCFYIYNVRSLHALVNFEQRRYCFQLKFKDTKLSYKQLFEWCEQNNLLENDDINE